jgi:biopolymer transport protein TolR
MRSLAKKSYRSQPIMNVTPLVDVVLVLLIIFMLVIPAMEKYARVDLPGIFNVDPEAKGKSDPFTLSVTNDGSMYFEEKKIENNRFVATLREANKREPYRRLLLRADRSADYGDVRRLFKHCQEVGFPGVSLRVNEIKEELSEK